MGKYTSEDEAYQDGYAEEMKYIREAGGVALAEKDVLQRCVDDCAGRNWQTLRRFFEGKLAAIQAAE